MSARAWLLWLAVTARCSLLARSSRTLNLISQPSTSLGTCVAVSCTDLEYGLAAVVRLVTWVLSWLLEIESLPMVAAEPIWTGAHPAISPPKAAATTAALTAVAVLIGMRRTATSLLTPLFQLVTPDPRTEPRSVRCTRRACPGPAAAGRQWWSSRWPGTGPGTPRPTKTRAPP